MDSRLLDLERSFGTSPLAKIEDPFLDRHEIKLWIKRDDLLHPIISGNKWRKLKYNLADALSRGADTLISMGGAYSNHLHALAYAGAELKLKTLGIIRGERPSQLTPTLTDMANWGMALQFVSRSEYRRYRNDQSNPYLPKLKSNEYWIPEGGANHFALQGVVELVQEIDITYDTLCVACGTGATLAGLIKAVPEHIKVLGFSALKNGDVLTHDVQALLTVERRNWTIFQAYHFGGFAKLNPELAKFMRDFEDKTIIPLEAVYTGKMLFGLYDLISKGYFKSGQRIIAIHTGGLQGKRGYRACKEN